MNLFDPDDTAAAKRATRKAAAARRDAIAQHAPGVARQAAGVALGEIARLRGRTRFAGYLAIRSEIDPRPLMDALHGLGMALSVPVTVKPGEPLRFRTWHPGARTEPGAMNTAVPTAGDWVTPEVLIVPLLAFDRSGYRLGYGGGFYDRTITRLRAEGPVVAVGFAFAGQEVEAVPRNAHDARLDAIVTEAGVIWPDASPA